MTSGGGWEPGLMGQSVAKKSVPETPVKSVFLFVLRIHFFNVFYDIKNLFFLGIICKRKTLKCRFHSKVYALYSSKIL